MFKVKQNMGGIDRALRFLAGSTLLTIGPLTNVVLTDTLSNTILSSMAVVALVSAGFSYCILYKVTGFNTMTNNN